MLLQDGDPAALLGQVSAAIKQRKAQLAPSIQELRSLRQQQQVMEDAAGGGVEQPAVSRTYCLTRRKMLHVHSSHTKLSTVSSGVSVFAVFKTTSADVPSDIPAHILLAHHTHTCHHGRS